MISLMINTCWWISQCEKTLYQALFKKKSNLLLFYTNLTFFKSILLIHTALMSVSSDKFFLPFNSMRKYNIIKIHKLTHSSVGKLPLGDSARKSGYRSNCLQQLTYFLPVVWWSFLSPPNWTCRPILLLAWLDLWQTNIYKVWESVPLC